MSDLHDYMKSVRFEHRRCYGCGRWWAYEVFAPGSPECPVCAGKRSDELAENIAKLLKTNSALRGVIARKARKR